MELSDLRRHWEQFGREDPFWAVLTHPDKRFGRWKPEEFFESGRVEIGGVLSRASDRLAERGLRIEFGRALDFGCGLGRATQALCGQFSQCDGVDIAASMVEAANSHNQYPDRCSYHLNTRDDLSLFPEATFDFVYTAHVLQHMRPDYARHYIGEFHRVVRPGGAILFELTTERATGTASPLVESARRARIEIGEFPPRIDAGQTYPLTVVVTNLGAANWPAVGVGGWTQITVGNHWSTRGGKLLRLDDGRGRLRDDLGPGESTDVTLFVRAPERPGRYRLDVDVVQEGVGWFADSGSVIASRPVVVRGTRLWSLLGALRSVPRKGTGTPGPIMEMYGTPEDEVVGWIRAAGGSVVDVFDWDEISGTRSTDWNRRGFLVAKPQAAAGS